MSLQYEKITVNKNRQCSHCGGEIGEGCEAYIFTGFNFAAMEQPFNYNITPHFFSHFHSGQCLEQTIKIDAELLGAEQC